MGFPGGSAGNKSSRTAGDLGFIPGLGRSPGERNSYPLQYSGLENSMDCIVHQVAKSWTRLSDFHFHANNKQSKNKVKKKKSIYNSTKVNKILTNWVLYTENYKILLKENDDLSKCKAILCLRIRRFIIIEMIIIIEMAIFPKLIHRFN